MNGDAVRQRFAAVRIDSLSGGMTIEGWYDSREQAEQHAATIGGTIVVADGCRGFAPSGRIETIRRPGAL